MGKDQQLNNSAEGFLSEEQEEVLDLYLQNLDDFYAEIKASEKLQVEIETMHLKRILGK